MTVAVGGLKDVVAVAAGFSHSLALDKSGNLWAWGEEDWGQLGTTVGASPCPGSLSCILTPTKVSVANVVAIDAGDRVSLVVTRDGTVWDWGTTACSKAPDGYPSCRSGPGGGPDVTDASIARIFMSAEVALRRDGTVWVWGSYTGPVTPNSDPFYSVTAEVPLQKAVDVFAGSNYGLAIEDDGTIWGWGDNTFGQLGNGDFGTGHVTPGKPIAASQTMKRFTGRIRTLAPGFNHTLILTK